MTLSFIFADLFVFSESEKVRKWCRRQSIRNILPYTSIYFHILPYTTIYFHILSIYFPYVRYFHTPILPYFHSKRLPSITTSLLLSHARRSHPIYIAYRYYFASNIDIHRVNINTTSHTQNNSPMPTTTVMMTTVEQQSLRQSTIHDDSADDDKEEVRTFCICIAVAVNSSLWWSECYTTIKQQPKDGDGNVLKRINDETRMNDDDNDDDNGDDDDDDESYTESWAVLERMNDETRMNDDDDRR